MFLCTIKGKVIFEGRYKTVRRCVEAAVEQEIDLTAVDLRRANLRHAMLDGAYMPGACFWGARLQAANMVGGNFDNADFRAANMTDSCLAESSFQHCDFSGAYFSRTIIRESDFSKACFSCPSIFSLPFSDVKSIKEAIYTHLGEIECEISKVPLTIRGGQSTIIYLDKYILIGAELLEIQKSGSEIGRLISYLEHLKQYNHSEL